MVMLDINTLLHSVYNTENSIFCLLKRATNFAVGFTVSVCEVPDSVFTLYTSTLYLKREDTKLWS